MAKNTSKEETKKTTTTEPKFPYTTKPSSLRRLLQEIPKRPKPEKFDKTVLKSWGFTDANDYSMLRVLKAVGLITPGNEPTELYSKYMQLDTGAACLAEPIRQVYKPLFQTSHTPYKESSEKLQNLFNIHSGGGERTLDQQIQTFKALSENALFDSLTVVPGQSSGFIADQKQEAASRNASTGALGAAVNINVHIHLPENKSRRDYEAMIEDIGRYIFGRQVEKSDA